ncbi:MAG: tRNA dihydrouridine synthase DusB [Oscillospiraceae bacterium]
MLIGTVKIESRLALAPMAGVTDLAFRSVCRSFGAGLTYTEMVSAKALCYQDGKTRSLLMLSPDEHPAAAQIFGSDAACMAEASAIASEISGADIIDINMGCPVGKVVKSGDGSALMRDPDKAMRIIEEVKKNCKKPVTIKMRIGWDKSDINAVPFAIAAEAAGASAIAVHGRTKVQMYSGRVNLDVIREVKEAVDIPVIANGDIFAPEDAAHILRRSGADMAMIGRGSLGNPWIFSRAEAAIRGDPVPPLPPVSERVDTALRQFELAAQTKGERLACLEARRHFAWYLKGVPYSGYFKDKITAVTTMDDIKNIALAIKDTL